MATQFYPLEGKLLDFKYALWLIWKTLYLPEPTPVQLDIANYLQDHSQRRRIIQAYRGAGKTWITAAYVCWRLRINPDLKFLVVSSGSDFALEVSSFIHQIINEIELFNCLIPDPDQRNSKLNFDVAPCKPDKSPSVKSAGIFGQITGSRADEIIADDIEIPRLVLTQMMRERLLVAVREFESILKPGGIITYLGTPHTEDSLYNKLTQKSYKRRIWTARYPSVEDLDAKYKGEISPFLTEQLLEDPKLKGKPTDSKRFNDIDLLEREVAMGKSAFQLQYQLDTTLSDLERYPLKLRDLVIMSLNPESAPQKIVWCNEREKMVNVDCVGLSGDKYFHPAFVHGEWIDYSGSVLFVDPSGRGTDETGYALVKHLNSYLFLLRWGGLKGGYDESTMEELTALVEAYKCNSVVIENNFGDGMFAQLLKPYLRRKKILCGIEEVRSNKQKELRIIETLEPVMNQHRLIVDKKVIEDDLKSIQVYPPDKQMMFSGFYQMTHLTKERDCLAHDDRIDALAGAVEYWTTSMALDEQEQIVKRNSELLDMEIEHFLYDTNVMTLTQRAYGMTPEKMRQSRNGSKAYKWVNTGHSGKTK